MSGKNLELSLVMRLRDLASSGFTRSQRDIQASIAKTEKSTDNLTRTVSNLGKMRSAAEVIGIRSEQNIKREIQRTEAAYNRLARSGTMSMREQARAAEATRNRIRELNNEMGKFTLGQKAMHGLQNGATIAGGVAAGGYVLSKPIGQTMDYGMQLAHMSNVAFNDRDTIGRIAGKRELNAGVVNATRIGGGNREANAETLDSLIASNAMSGKDSIDMLPTIVKAATASNSKGTELAQIGISGIKTFGLKKGEMGSALNMGIVGGQLGSFELKDMAYWLPQQMAAAKGSGMTGISGFAKLIAANQASAITAGSKDEAGNNLVNLLTKINSQDTAIDAQKQGINLSGTLAAARGKGIDSLDAFVGIVDNVVGKNKDYQALQTKLKTTTGAERKSVLESQANILQGSAIGKIVQDRQALMALVAIMGNREYMKGVQNKVLAEANAKSGEGATDKNFAVISNEAGYKVQQAENEKIFATQNAFENLTPLVGSVADGFSSIAKEYPSLTAATVAATTALAALAATAGVSALLGGKGAGLEAVLSKTKAAPGMLGRGALAAGGALVSTTGAAVLASGTVGYGIGTMIYDHGIKGTETEDRIGGMIATILASLGNEEAQKSLEINLHLDGEQVATVVNKRNARTATRN